MEDLITLLQSTAIFCNHVAIHFPMIRGFLDSQNLTILQLFS